MTKGKRRSYTQEYKEEAVKIVTEQGYKISEASRNLGINPNLLGRWKRQFEIGDGDCFNLDDKDAVESELMFSEKVAKKSVHFYLTRSSCEKLIKKTRKGYVQKRLIHNF